MIMMTKSVMILVMALPRNTLLRLRQVPGVRYTHDLLAGTH